ncbi:MAG: CoA-acylating methylmalonate-semialdehyde dehydrogenase [Planctomycetota bacterium]|jgi:malonate-semialdehyde dehydrogenase (acetylating)/methylmalonate-semialdehyde dehydrogenase
MSDKTVLNYVNGKWSAPERAEWFDIENPSTGEVLGKTVLSTAEEIDRAVSAARDAFPAWSATPVTQRTTYLYKLLGLLRENGEEVARQLTEEMGKSLPDSRAEMKRVYQNIEVACAAPMLQQGQKLVGCAQGIDGETLLLPVGVFAAITPFNFPAMAPFWFIPYAIATGNTFILKPSESVPLTMELVTKYIEKAGLPPGVFNLVNGDKAAAIALVEHPDVAGVSFVGRSDTCRTIAERCAALGKRCQAMGSAKNHLVVMPDYTHVAELIRNMSTSCYGCAGQRCMASSAIVVVGDEMYGKVCKQFVADSKNFIVANPLDPAMASEPMLMGPVISAQSRQFILDMIETGVREGATLALDGRELTVEGAENGHFVGPTVFVDVEPGMKIHTTEIFGPVVCIMKAGSLDEAIGIINDHQYSNACSIYTKSGYYARRFKLGVKTGMVGVNVGIPAPVPFLPFGGMGDSMHCDIKMQGESAFRFYTENKVVVERYWEEE